MAYRFKLKETAQAGVRRIVSGQLDKVLAKPEAAGRADWVHETRKTLKRLRALLRLMRSGIGDEPWRVENAHLRDIARELSGMRDRDVLGRTMANLDGTGGKGLAPALVWLAARLAPAPTAAETDDTGTMDTAVGTAIDQLAKARERLVSLQIDGELADVLAAGIKSSRRKARKALAAVEKSTKSEDLHELRKAVQAHWRHMQLVQAAWPAVHQAHADAARQISLLLGEVQDLAVLAEFATSASASDGDRRHARRIATACARRQEELCASAIPQAARLFAASGKAAAAEISGAWIAAIRLAAVTGKTAAPASAKKGQRKAPARA